MPKRHLPEENWIEGGYFMDTELVNDEQVKVAYVICEHEECRQSIPVVYSMNPKEILKELKLNGWSAIYCPTHTTDYSTRRINTAIGHEHPF